ncbi:MAG: c-type cytochrome [Gemmatimonadetes bacterium]|nr:c-type cytochrome [Gemmatimonadota bacterium]
MREAAVGLGVRLVLLGLVGVIPAAAQDRPMQNLQYFSTDITRDSLVQEMRQFSFALGVRCQYCHVGGDGVSFEGVVFESDEDPDKRKARHMLRLVDVINDGLLPMMVDRDSAETRVTCKTCHRGVAKPALLTDVLLATLDEHGPDSTVTQYDRLRATTMASGMFDFGEWEMNTLAERLARDGRPQDAITIYSKNLEHYPESVSILLALGQLNEEIENVGEAVDYYRRALEVAPGNGFATARLEALTGRQRRSP